MPGPVFLRGDRVDLHVIEEEDLPFLQRLINDPRVWGSLFQVTPKRMADEEEFIEATRGEDTEAHFLICADGDPVGTVGLSGISHHWGTGEVGYYVDPDEQDEGYATAGVGRLVDYAFDDRRLEKLHADALATNPGSRRVLEKNGFAEEGRFRDHGFVDGERVDVVRYGLLPDER
jgi:RimJ/RimL family protein N-acetyltransferase